MVPDVAHGTLARAWNVITPSKEATMMHHPAIAQQLMAERQRDLLDRASRHRPARAARAAQPASPATAPRTGPYLLRRAFAALTSH